MSLFLTITIWIWRFFIKYFFYLFESIAAKFCDNLIELIWFPIYLLINVSGQYIYFLIKFVKSICSLPLVHISTILQHRTKSLRTLATILQHRPRSQCILITIPQHGSQDPAHTDQETQGIQTALLQHRPRDAGHNEYNTGTQTKRPVHTDYYTETQTSRSRTYNIPTIIP
jgi:hypothetical protein